MVNAWFQTLKRFPLTPHGRSGRAPPTMSFYSYERTAGYARSVGSNVCLEMLRSPVGSKPLASAQACGAALRDRRNNLPELVRNALPNRCGVKYTKVKMEGDQFLLVLRQTRPEITQTLVEGRQAVSMRLGHEGR